MPIKLSTSPAPPYAITPANMHGFLAWNFDPMEMTGNAAPSAATIYLVKIAVPQTITVTNIEVVCAVAGTNYTNSQAGLYDSTGALLSSSTVRATGGTDTFVSTGHKTLALQAAQSVTGGPTTFVWAAMHMGTNSATAVQFAVHNSGVAATADMGVNVGLAAAVMRHPTQTGHITNNLATIGNLTPASNAGGSSTVIWMALS